MVPVTVQRQRSQNACTCCILWAIKLAFSLCRSSILRSRGLRNLGACSFLARSASGSGIQVKMLLCSNFICLLDVHVYHVHLNRGQSLLFKTKLLEIAHVIIQGNFSPCVLQPVIDFHPLYLNAFKRKRQFHSLSKSTLKTSNATQK